MGGLGKRSGAYIAHQSFWNYYLKGAVSLFYVFFVVVVFLVVFFFNVFLYVSSLQVTYQVSETWKYKPSYSSSYLPFMFCD